MFTLWFTPGPGIKVIVCSWLSLRMDPLLCLRVLATPEDLIELAWAPLIFDRPLDFLLTNSGIPFEDYKCYLSPTFYFDLCEPVDIPLVL